MTLTSAAKLLTLASAIAAAIALPYVVGSFLLALGAVLLHGARAQQGCR